MASNLGDVKLRDFGSWLSQSARPSILKQRLSSTYNNYVQRNFGARKTRLRPFVHIVFGVIFVNYAFFEYRHIVHDRQRKYH